MMNKSHRRFTANSRVSNSFMREWSWSALGYSMMAGLIIGIGGFVLPLNCFLISSCLGVGAEAIGWVMPIALLLTGVGVAAALGWYIGKRQQELIEHHLSMKIGWQSATQYGLIIGFAFSSLLLIPLIHRFCSMDMNCDIACCIQVFAVLFPLVSFTVGTVQWLSLRQVVNDARRWIGIHTLSSVLISIILFLSTTTTFSVRLTGAALSLLCVVLLKYLIGTEWHNMIFNLGLIALVSSLLLLFADDVLVVLLGIQADAVEIVFSPLYLVFLAGILSVFKAHMGAVALLDML